MTPPACPNSKQNDWQTCTSGDPDCQLKKKTGYIQNMFQCLNIKNLQSFQLGGGEGGRVRGGSRPQLENSN